MESKSKPTNRERWFGDTYTAASITVSDELVYGEGFRVLRLEGDLIARIPYEQYSEWLNSEWEGSSVQHPDIWE